MKSSATNKFWAAYRNLPPFVRSTARKQFRIWLKDPNHPSLQFKKVGPFWSVRVTRGYRALALFRRDTYYWFFIGSHDQYERLLDKK